MQESFADKVAYWALSSCEASAIVFKRAAALVGVGVALVLVTILLVALVLVALVLVTLVLVTLVLVTLVLVTLVEVVETAVEVVGASWRACKAGADLTGASTASMATRNKMEVALRDIIVFFVSR